MHRKSVLFPEPERPKMTTHSPLATSRSTPFSTSWSPKNLWISRSSTTGRTSVPMRTTVPHIIPLEPLLQPSLEVGEDAREDPIDKGRHDKRLKVLEVLASDLGGAEEELLGADDTDEGGVFDHGDELVARRRDYDPYGLGKHYAAHGLRPRHPEGLSSLDLAVPHGLDAGPEDFRHVRPVVYPEGQHTRGYRPEDEETLQRRRSVLGQLREAQVDKEDLHHKRRPPDKGDIETTDTVEDWVFGETAQRSEQR